MNDQLLFNLLVSLLRFGNIFFLTCVPLLSKESPSLLQVTPYVGGTGLIVVILSVISVRIQRIIVRSTLYFVVLSGIFLGILFGGFDLFTNYLFYLGFSLLLGISLTGTEILGLRLAILSNERAVIRNNLALFNSLKVSGYALGFLLGCLVVGSDLTVRIARLFILFIAVTIILIGSLGILRFRHRAICENDDPASTTGAIDLNTVNKPKTPNRLMGIAYFGFIIIDVAVFSFWYIYIPYRLHTVNGIPSVTVGAWLSTQAFVHACFQHPWRLFLKRTGEVWGYFISLSLHLTVIILITHLPSLNYGLLSFLFVMMGIVNSGTYISSGTLFHSTVSFSSKTRSVSVHQIGSSLGKYLGTTIGNRSVM